MDSHQAKEILLLYREGIDHPDNPEFAEALAFTKSDPVFAAWFEQQRAVQAALRASFKNITVPEGLKEQIVSERRARLTLGFKRKALLVASAVAIAILLATAVITLNRPPGEDKHFSGFRSRMAGIVLRAYPKMDLESADLRELHQYLVQHGREDYALPPTLTGTAGTGCKLLTWQGKPVSMVCLNSGKNGKPKQPDLFLFIIQQSAVPDPPSATSEAVQFSKLSMLTWTQNGQLYLLGALGPQARQVQDSVAADVRRL